MSCQYLYTKQNAHILAFPIVQIEYISPSLHLLFVLLYEIWIYLWNMNVMMICHFNFKIKTKKNQIKNKNHAGSNKICDVIHSARMSFWFCCNAISVCYYSCFSALSYVKEEESRSWKNVNVSYLIVPDTMEKRLYFSGVKRRMKGRKWKTYFFFVQCKVCDI